VQEKLPQGTLASRVTKINPLNFYSQSTIRNIISSAISSLGAQPFFLILTTTPKRLTAKGQKYS
jgi:hypothetical protein